MAIQKGDKVSVQYTGKLENGEEFDSSAKHGQPLTFTVGEGQLIKGFDDGVLGMEKGEKKSITIPAAEAYGDRREELQQEMPRASLPPEIVAEVGTMLAVQGPDGQQFPAQIVKVDETNITVDLNHPLAGKTLIFDIEIEEVESQ